MLRNVGYGRLNNEMFQCQNQGIPEGVEKNRGLEEIFEQIVGENFPNLAREANIRVQEAEKTPPKLNHDKPTPRHVIVQFANIRSRIQY